MALRKGGKPKPRPTPMQGVVKAIRQHLPYDLNTAQNELLSLGYVSVFQHTQGQDNVFILWTNLSTGDELMTVSRAPRVVTEGLSFRSTALFRLHATNLESTRRIAQALERQRQATISEDSDHGNADGLR